jgi:hypothetical protein
VPNEPWLIAKIPLGVQTGPAWPAAR